MSKLFLLEPDDLYFSIYILVIALYTIKSKLKFQLTNKIYQKIQEFILGMFFITPFIMLVVFSALSSARRRVRIGDIFNFISQSNFKFIFILIVVALTLMSVFDFIFCFLNKKRKG